jgi:N-acetyl sugar amidotransferase
MTLVRCKTCLMPTTRPDTAFVSGECSACVNYKNRQTLDWKAREAELIRMLEASTNGTGFHCVVPSSGGKDSVYQTLRVIELGFRPLVVTASTCMLTEVGRRNIDNLARHATTIEVTPNRDVRAKLNRLGLELVGDISLPEHWAIFSIPFRMAADLGIPTLLYGECPQEAYGGPIGTEAARTMTRRWVSEFGGFLGCRPLDMVGMEGITEADMRDYMLPDEDKLSRVTAYWLGQFELWDSHRNVERAAAAGMIQQLPCMANWWVGENQDNAMTGLHDHVMFRKYGYGRGCAQISVDIRSGRVKRSDALDWVRRHDGAFPWFYMGVSAHSVTKVLGMPYDDMYSILCKHTNWELFDQNMADCLVLKEFAEAACSPAA